MYQALYYYRIRHVARQLTKCELFRFLPCTIKDDIQVNLNLKRTIHRSKSKLQLLRHRRESPRASQGIRICYAERNLSL